MSWRAVDGGSWMFIENNLIITCCSAFALRRLWVTSSRTGLLRALWPFGSISNTNRSDVEEMVNESDRYGRRSFGKLEDDVFAEYESAPRTESSTLEMSVVGKTDECIAGRSV